VPISHLLVQYVSTNFNKEQKEKTMSVARDLLIDLDMREIEITHNGKDLITWPTKFVGEKLAKILKSHRRDILDFMTGFAMLEEGDLVLTPRGEMQIVELRPELDIGRIGLKASKASRKIRYFDLTQISSRRRFNFLSTRSWHVKEYARLQKGAEKDLAYEWYKYEWDWLISEISRLRQHLGEFGLVDGKGYLMLPDPKENYGSFETQNSNYLLN
jgi:hypothetical protein